MIARTAFHQAPWLLLLAAAVLAVYWPGLGGGFVFDDFPNIVDNTRLHVTTLAWPEWVAAAFSSDAGPASRSLAMLSFALQHYLTGLDPWAMKLGNVALHACNALLVLALARKLLALAAHPGVSSKRREWIARFVAAAWALHPINLMAVLLVVQRMESLSHTFVFAGLWMYLHGRQRQLEGGNGWPLVLGGLIGGTVLGLLAKESAVLLPLYAFLAEAMLVAARRTTGAAGAGIERRIGILFVVILLVPALLGLAWLLPQMLAPAAWSGRDFTLAERLLTEARVVMDYLRWILLPDLGQLSLYHDDYLVSRGLLRPWTTVVSIVLLAALAATAWLLRRRLPLTALGIAWFLSAHLLTATIIPFELVYEHRNYFASFGILLAAAELLLLVPRRDALRRIGALVAVLFVVVAAGLTHLRAREWSDPYRFAASEAAKHPQSPRATYGLAKLLADASGYDPASPLFAEAERALHVARRAPGSSVLPHSGLLLMAEAAGRQADPAIWREMQDRLRSAPIGPQETGAIGSLARCATQGECRFPIQQMEATFAAALSRGDNAELLSQLSDYRLNAQGDLASAVELARKAVSLQPGTAQYRVNLVRLLIAAGEKDEARRQIAILRASGRLGRNEQAARELEHRLLTWPETR